LALARGVVALVARLGPASIPRLAEARIDARLFLFALGVSVATGILFGIAPAVACTGGNLNATLRESGPAAPWGGPDAWCATRWWLRKWRWRWWC